MGLLYIFMSRFFKKCYVRIGLFLMTNLAVLVVLLVASIFGIGSVHSAGGLNLTSLMIMCFAYGMITTIVSLFLSKWMAKKSCGCK